MSGSGDEGDKQSSSGSGSGNRRAMAYDSTIARSFAEQLDGAFSLDEGLSSLSDTIANKHLTLQSQSRELEELQARIRAAEEALERAGGQPPPRSNGARDVRDLWASQSATDPEDEAAYAEARVASGTAKATANSSSTGPPSRAAPPPPPPPSSGSSHPSTNRPGVTAPAPSRAAPPPPPGRAPPVPGARTATRKMDYESEDDDDDEEDEEDDDDEEEEEEEQKVPRRK